MVGCFKTKVQLPVYEHLSSTLRTDMCAAKQRPQVTSVVKRKMVLLLTPHPLSYYFKPKKGRIIFPLNCATICTGSFKSEYVTSPPVTYWGGGGEVSEGEKLPWRRWSFPRGEVCLSSSFVGFHAPKETGSSQHLVESCPACSKVGCGGSPVLQLPVLFGELGISHISWPKIWGRGKSSRRSDFTTGAKVCKHVRKHVCLLSQRESQRKAGSLRSMLWIHC